MFESVTHVFVEDGVPHMFCLRNRQLRWSWCRRYVLGLLFVRGFFFSFLYCFKFWPASPQQVLLRTSSGRLASVSFAALMYFRHNWGCSSSKNLSDLFGSRSPFFF